MIIIIQEYHIFVVINKYNKYVLFSFTYGTTKNVFNICIKLTMYVAFLRFKLT